MSVKKKPLNESLLKYHEDIRVYRQKSSDLFERQLVYISGGAIAICLGLLQAEHSIISEQNRLPFQFALGSFIATLLLNLVSHKTSIKSLDLELDSKVKESEKWDKATDILNYLSMATIVVGLISIFITVSKIKLP